MAKMINLETVDKFWLKVKPGKPDECWEWPSYKNSSGYGYITHKKVNYRAHRIAAFTKYGHPPSSLHDAMHVCDNPPCVNPNHISWGTRAENLTQARKHVRIKSIKLTELQVSYIKRLSEYGYSSRVIASWYDISNTLVLYIKRGKAWLEIEPYQLRPFIATPPNTQTGKGEG